MTRKTRVPLVCLATIAIVSIAVCSGGAPAADESPREILDGLRRQGKFDQAMQYLAEMESNQNASAEVKGTIRYEQGLTLLFSARAEKDPAKREKRLAESQRYFEQLLADHGDHSLVPSGRKQLANVLLERARAKAETAKQSGIAKDEKEQRLEDSRKLFDRADALFEQILVELREELKKLYPPPSDPEKLALRDKLRADYVSVQFTRATILYEKALTFDPGSEQRLVTLKEAAEAFGTVHDKYRRRVAGLHAWLQAGRCYQEMRDLARALECYEELLHLPAEPIALFELKTKATRRALECHLDESRKEYESAMRCGRRWLDATSGLHEDDPDGLAVRFLLASATKLFADSLDQGDASKREHLQQAWRLARHVAQYEGEHRAAAKELLKELPADAATVDHLDKLTDFATAKAAGRKALDEFEIAKGRLRQLRDEMAKANDEPQRAELAEQVALERKLAADSRNAAIDAFTTALTFADDRTPVAQVNAVRYFLAYLRYTQGQYIRAAELGELVVRRGGETVAIRASAGIALHAYVKLYQQAPDPAERRAAADKAVKTAELIVARWPNKKTADDARTVLAHFGRSVKPKP